MTADRYAIPAAPHRVEQVIERSRFICSLAHVESPDAAQRFIRQINAEFVDATHNCWAYVAGPPGSTSRIGSSDAGEPHGTAGRPMLTMLLHSGVGEIAAVVTRYYGGTKLGTGGLVKAYSGTVKLALQALPVREYVDTIDVAIDIDYASLTLVQQHLVALRAELTGQEFGAAVLLRVRVARSDLDALRHAIADVTRGMGVVRTVAV